MILVKRQNSESVKMDMRVQLAKILKFFHTKYNLIDIICKDNFRLRNDAIEHITVELQSN